MPLMQYKAMDERGKIVTGRLEAANGADLEVRLSRMGQDLISHREARIKTGMSTSTRVKRREMIGFCFQLEQLLTSGVPMVEALVDLRDSTDDRNMRFS